MMVWREFRRCFRRLLLRLSTWWRFGYTSRKRRRKNMPYFYFIFPMGETWMLWASLRLCGTLLLNSVHLLLCGKRYRHNWKPHLYVSANIFAEKGEPWEKRSNKVYFETGKSRKDEISCKCKIGNSLLTWTNFCYCVGCWDDYC